MDQLLYSLLPLPESSPGVTEVTIIEKLPAERHMISSWEQVSVTLLNPHLPAMSGQLKCPGEGKSGQETFSYLRPQPPSS